jgi:hypothetical protein
VQQEWTGKQAILNTHRQNRKNTIVFLAMRRGGFFNLSDWLDNQDSGASVIVTSPNMRLVALAVRSQLGTSIDRLPDRLQPYAPNLPNFLRPPFPPTSATCAEMRDRWP